MTIEFDYEESVMGLIIQSGAAKSFCFEALSLAKKGDFDGSKVHLAQAQEALLEAHKIQTMLIGADEGEGKVPVHLVMVHAQDHLMTSMLAKELIEELIELHQAKSDT